MYCLCVNVYCTTATGWQSNCSQQIYHIIKNLKLSRDPTKSESRYNYYDKKILVLLSHPQEDHPSTLRRYSTACVEQYTLTLHILRSCSSTGIWKRTTKWWQRRNFTQKWRLPEEKRLTCNTFWDETLSSVKKINYRATQLLRHYAVVFQIGLVNNIHVW